jgi:hypothetical protein
MAVSFTAGHDSIIPTEDGQTYLGGAGNDSYILSESLIVADSTIVIQDTEGANKIQLVDGLSIASSTVTANAVELSLSNGAKIQILGADNFGYDIGGNALAGVEGTAQTFTEFVEDTLGTNVPAAGEGPSVGGEVEISDDGSGGTPQPDGEEHVLTVNADNLTGDDADDLFTAPVLQNDTGSGELANTFETGDVLDGGDGTDILQADLIATGTIQDNNAGAAIAANTTSIENVFLTAQTPQNDNANNTTWASTVDAGSMNDVQQWWTDESRANVQIEDIRTRPIDTTFGVRLTDPGVGFNAYFNSLFIDGGEITQSQLIIQIAELDGGVVNNAVELENISVNSLSFEFDGQEITLASDAMADADTWADLKTAIEDALDAEGLGDLQVMQLDNGQFRLFDAEGRVFSDQGGFSASATTDQVIDIRNRISQDLDTQDDQTQTTLILDGAGSGSQGGGVNIAGMSGDRGVEVMDVLVDRDSHISSLTSVNDPNGTNFSFSAEQQLEEVNVAHLADGSEGDLQIGTRTQDAQGVSTTMDDRLNTDGLVDVRTFDAAGFEGELKIGATLTGNAFDKYLNDAEDTVPFVYQLGDGGANLSLSVDNTLAGDVDFQLDINGGLLDDRINLEGLAVKQSTSVDGGDGENTLEVTTSTGFGASNAGFDQAEPTDLSAEETSFNSVSNIDTVVIGANDTINVGTQANAAAAIAAAGNFGDTTHDITAGGFADVNDFVIATDVATVNYTTPAGVAATTTLAADTRLINLNTTEQSVSISGENQTLGTGNSDSDQDFGTIRISDAAGEALGLALDNTARATGNLDVAQILVDGDDSDVRIVTLDSQGTRNTDNTVGSFNGEEVTDLLFTGTQDLAVRVDDIASTDDDISFVIDGSDLEGDLTLVLDAALNDEDNDDVLIGAEGENDTLALFGEMGAATFNASVSDFETVQFGYLNNGAVSNALNGGAEAVNGRYDSASDAGVTTYQIANLDGAIELDNLGNDTNVVLGEATPANAVQILNNDITLTGNEDQTDINIEILDDIALNGLGLIEVNEFRDIVITIDHEVTEERGDSDGVNDFAKDDQLVLDIDFDSDVRAALADGEDVDYDADTLTINAEIGVDLTNAVLVDGMTIKTGDGDDIIDMGTAGSLTVDAGDGIDVFNYGAFQDSPNDDRDNIVNFEASNEENEDADVINITDLVDDLGYANFVFLGTVSNVTEGDMNRTFAQYNEGVGYNSATGTGTTTLTALYNADEGAIYFDTNSNGVIGTVDALDLSFKLTDLTGDMSFANFEAENAAGDSVVGRVLTLTQLQTAVDDSQLDEDPIPLPSYIVLRDTAERLINNEEQVDELIGEVDGEVQVTGEVSAEQETALDALFAAYPDGYVIIEDVEPVDIVEPDTDAPVLDTTIPADDATDVAVDANLVLTFDEDVQAGTGNISVFNADGLVEAVSVEDAIFDGSTVIVDLLTDLEPGTDYFVRVQPTAIEDEAGNAFAGFGDPTALNFTTAAGSGDDLTEVDLSDFSVEDAAGGDFQFNADSLGDTDVWAATIANFNAGDLLNINDEYLAADNMMFAITGTDEINFAFGDINDFIPTFTINLTDVDETVVSAVAAAAGATIDGDDTADIIDVLQDAWGEDWLVDYTGNGGGGDTNIVVSVDAAGSTNANDAVAETFDITIGDYAYTIQDFDPANDLLDFGGDSLDLTAADLSLTNNADDGEAVLSYTPDAGETVIEITLMGLSSSEDLALTSAAGVNDILA